CSLAQILEPKLLAHEILKFAKTYLIAKRMRHDSAIACTSNVRGVGGFKKGDKGTDFVSALQLRACEAKFKSPCIPF
ncbi:hypothetical protein, partial [Campylobacter concisus]|uniref:hypothetical protein n=1 Tax=Campylobacter concisus TaxID=199 RepID=UPI0005535ACD